MLNEEKKGYIGNPSQLALVRRVTAHGRRAGAGHSARFGAGYWPVPFPGDDHELDVQERL